MAIDQDDLDLIDDNEDPGKDESGKDDPGKDDPGNEDPGNKDPGNKDPGNKDPGNKDPDLSWRDSIKDEKALKQAERFTSVEKLAQSNRTMRQKISEMIIIPGKDADEVEVARFRKQMGIPEEAKGYEFPKFEEGEDTEENIASREKWQGILHRNNVSKEAAEDIIKEYRQDGAAAIKAAMDADKRFADETDAALREEWGGDYDKNKSFANRAVTDLFGDTYQDIKEIETKDGKFVMDHPAFVKVFGEIGRQMSEGNFGEGPVSVSELETLEEQADEFRSKQKEASERGDTKAAIKWDAKEREVLAKIGGTRPVVGSEGRTT